MRRAFVFSLVLGALIPSLAARAQTPSVPDGEFSASRYIPAPGPYDYFMVEGARVDSHLAPSFGLSLGYEHEPFVLYDARCDTDDTTNCDVTAQSSAIVSMIASANVTASLSLYRRVQVGLLLPFVYTQGETFTFTRGSEPFALRGGDSITLADPRLSVKVRISGDATDGPAVAASVYVSAPLGQELAPGRYVGDELPVVGGHVIGEFVQRRYRIAGNAGLVWRNSATLFSTQVGAQIAYGLAAGYDLTPLVTGFVELTGASSFTSEVDENPMEGRLGLKLRSGDFTFHLGGGAGLVSGVGVPVFRAMGGISWNPDRADRDGDGVLDRDDACPTDAEDRDGHQDGDGCPDADNDADGIADEDDPCPDQAEDMDGQRDDDGCPDQDNDNDGVPDGYDSCPGAQEDMDGDRDDDGCPDNDRDRDGIEDAADRCPDEAEDTDGYGDEDGCPETDFDQDGVPDDGDQCPDQPENLNGFEDTDGCPDEARDSDGDGFPDATDQCPNAAETINGRADFDGCPDGTASVRVQGTQLLVTDEVRFAQDGVSIDGRSSLRALDAVAALIKLHPEYGPIRVEGHTETTGDRAAQVELSRQRAQAVVNYLVEQGVPASRLEVLGVGPDRPIDTSNSSRAHRRNRRVEFHFAAPPGT